MKPSLLHLLVSVLAIPAALAGTVAAEPSIRAVRCTQDGDDLAASIRYVEDGGRTLDYRLELRADRAGTTSLRDDAGRLVATATADAAGTSVRLGASWTSQTFRNLIAVLDDPGVQDGLTTCAAPMASLPGVLWPTFCPILVFVWDEDLVRQLCRWMPTPTP